MWISRIYPVGFWRKLMGVQFLMLPKQIVLAILLPWVGNPRLLLVNPYRGFCATIFIWNLNVD